MHARLVEGVTPFNNALQMPDVAANLNVNSDLGRALLDEIVTQQAAMIAYLNDFKLLMMLTLAMIPLVLIIRAARTGGRRKASGSRDRLDSHGRRANSFLIISVCSPSAGTGP